MAILPDNEYTEFENRAYVNPQVSLDEQTAFIDKLRQTQQANNQQIKTDTYNLGTAVPSNLGGLTGGEGYFTARYQTPQTNSLVNDLRAVNQATALKQVLENEQAKMKHRYNKAYNANAVRKNTPTTTDPAQKGEVETKTVNSGEHYGLPDTIVSETETSYIFTDTKTGKQTTVSKEYMNKLYDENGNLTPDGQVILDTRNLLGL